MFQLFVQHFTVYGRARVHGKSTVQRAKLEGDGEQVPDYYKQHEQQNCHLMCFKEFRNII